MLIPLTKQEVKSLRATDRQYILEIYKTKLYKFKVFLAGVEEDNKKLYQFSFVDIPQNSVAKLDINKYNETWSLYKDVSDLELRLINITDHINLNKSLTIDCIKKLLVPSEEYTKSGYKVRRSRIYRLVLGKNLNRTEDTYCEYRVKIRQVYGDKVQFIQYKSTYEPTPSNIIITCKFTENKKNWALFNK